MQGALVALVVECAALARAEHALGPGQVVSELDLRYLAPCSAGPVVGRPRFLGRAETRLLHVELFDAGRDHRLTTTALARVVGTSHSPVPGGFGADVHA